MNYSDKQRVIKILDTCRKLQQYLSETGLTPEALQNSFSAQWTVTTPLYNMGEHAYNISAELKQSTPDIPWFKIAGMRHRLVHNYEGTDWSLISRVVFFELDPLAEQQEKLLETME